MIGWDEEKVAPRLKMRSLQYGSGEKTTALYRDTDTMQAYGLTPGQWAKTSRIDKKIMGFKLALESFYQDIAQTNAKARANIKAGQG